MRRHRMSVMRKPWNTGPERQFLRYLFIAESAPRTFAVGSHVNLFRRLVLDLDSSLDVLRDLINTRLVRSP